MRNSSQEPQLKFYIGDVRDLSSVENAIHGVDYVFHAAALKQVPSCEFHPTEAVKTNIYGAENVIKAAINARVKRVVLLSTDKAVYPINTMGMTKAVMEKLMMASARQLDEKNTILCATRYGNVMASRGSVIPRFIEQIKENKPLTVTDPKMTRFLMSLKDSHELVFHAFQHAKQGDIFVQKSPAATIGNLGQALKNIFGSKMKDNIIGTRHGEKLFETLLSREEWASAEDMGRYFRVPMDTRDLNYESFFSKGESLISKSKDYTSHNTKQLEIYEIEELMQSLEFVREQLNA